TAETPKNKTHTLVVRVPLTTPSVILAWFIEKGDIDQVGGFTVHVKGTSGKTILEQNSSKGSRMLRLKPEVGGPEEFLITLTAKGLNGEDLDKVELDVNTSEVSTDPQLYLEVNEIRKDRARMAWVAQGVELSEIANYRLTVRRNGPDGQVIANIKMQVSSKATALKGLRANSQFYVKMEAVGKDKTTIVWSELIFKTATEDDEAGEPAFGSTGTPPPPPPTTTATTAIVDTFSTGATMDLSTSASGDTSATDATMDVSSVGVTNEDTTGATMDVSSAGVTNEDTTGATMDMSSAATAETSSDVTTDGMTEKTMQVSTVGTAETQTEVSTGRTDVDISGSTAAEEITTSASCLPQLRLTVSKETFQRLKFNWEPNGVDRKDVDYIDLVIYELGLFTENKYWEERLQWDERETTVAGLMPRRSYLFVVDIRALDGSSIAKVKMDYYPDAMEDVEC
ncbi:hypothetical protein EGW08_003002, partial [Elysia chlorotica]